MKAQKTVSHRDALELVFANRNKAYGAYQIRREYPKTLVKALGIGLGLIALLTLLPNLLKAFEYSNIIEEDDGGRIICMPPKITIALSKPLPKLKKSKTPKSIIKFVPPIVESDELVQDTDAFSSHDVLIQGNQEIGRVTSSGLDNAGPPDLGAESLISEKKGGTGIPDDGIKAPYELQKAPSFIGGESELFEYLKKHIRYPDLARENNIQGVVVLSFVIGKEGEIYGVEIIKDIGGGCGQESVRVVSAMPNWLPGESNGYPVKVRYTIPVRFNLQ